MLRPKVLLGGDYSSVFGREDHGAVSFGRHPEWATLLLCRIHAVHGQDPNPTILSPGEPVRGARAGTIMNTSVVP